MKVGRRISLMHAIVASKYSMIGLLCGSHRWVYGTQGRCDVGDFDAAPYKDTCMWEALVSDMEESGQELMIQKPRKVAFTEHGQTAQKTTTIIGSRLWNPSRTQSSFFLVGANSYCFLLLWSGHLWQLQCFLCGCLKKQSRNFT